jgi:hypothetical protein
MFFFEKAKRSKINIKSVKFTKESEYEICMGIIAFMVQNVNFSIIIIAQKSENYLKRKISKSKRCNECDHNLFFDNTNITFVQNKGVYLQQNC